VRPRRCKPFVNWNFAPRKKYLRNNTQFFIRRPQPPLELQGTDAIIAAAWVNAMKRDAFKRCYIPAGGGPGVDGTCAQPSPEILKLQAEIIAGAKFIPHVSTGHGPTEYLGQMTAEPFEPFTFSPTGRLPTRSVRHCREEGRPPNKKWGALVSGALASASRQKKIPIERCGRYKSVSP